MKFDIKQKVLLCILISIEAIFCFTPLGSMPIGPIVATLSMIPVIITTLVFGLKLGIVMGGMFGLFSFLVWTFIPPNPAIAFLFTPFYDSLSYRGNFGSIIVCFVPRILIAVFSHYVYKFSVNIDKQKSMIIASFIGSFVNTVFVLLFILLFFNMQYEEVTSNSIFRVMIITIFTNGLIEAIISSVLCPIVSQRLIKFNKSN